MQPVPPWALKPRAVPSSPDSWMKSVPDARRWQRGARQIGRGILGADDVLAVLRQPGQRLHRNIGNGTAGHVVDENRDIDRIGDGTEVLIEAFLRRLVVIGNDDEGGIGAGFLCVNRIVNRFGGAVRAGSGDHGNAATDFLDAHFDDGLVLVGRQGRAFAGGADGDHSVAPLVDLPVDEFPECLLVHLAMLHGSDESGKRTSERHGHILR